MYFSNDNFIRICSVVLRKRRDFLQDNERGGRACYWNIVPFYLGCSDRDSEMQEYVKGKEVTKVTKVVKKYYPQIYTDGHR